MEIIRVFDIPPPHPHTHPTERTHTYTHTHKHTLIHTYIHTQTNKQTQNTLIILKENWYSSILDNVQSKLFP